MAIKIPNLKNFENLSADERAEILENLTEEETWDSLSEEEKEQIVKLDWADIHILNCRPF